MPLLSSVNIVITDPFTGHCQSMLVAAGVAALVAAAGACDVVVADVVVAEGAVGVAGTVPAVGGSVMLGTPVAAGGTELVGVDVVDDDAGKGSLFARAIA
jgi:hypothetical protein